MRAIPDSKGRISHYYDVADKVVIMQRIQGPSASVRLTDWIALSLSLSLSVEEERYANGNDIVFLRTLRCAAHNQRGRPADMRERERERERERDSLIHISTYLYFLVKKIASRSHSQASQEYS